MQRDLTFTGGQVLGAQCLAPADLSVRDGRFENGPAGPDGRAVDVSGLWLLPGIVDLHGDGFERHLAPRRGVMTDLAKGLESVEAELATCGITTAWLALFWSWEGSMRGPDFATRFAQALTGSRAARRLDLRMQLRLESHMVEDGDAVRALIATHGIDYLVINDHLPHARLAEGRTPPRLTGSALKAGRSPEAHLAEMQYRAAQGPKVAGFVEALARDRAPRGVRLGTHDDPDAETRARHAAQGLDICEFPTTRAAAAAAHAAGAPVIMGAPPVLRGGNGGAQIIRHKHARAGPRGQQAGVLQMANRLAQRRARHAQPFGQITFGRQARAGAQHAAQDQLFDLADHGGGKLFRLNGAKWHGAPALNW